MNPIFETPKESHGYLKVSMIRTGIVFFLLFALFHTTGMWPDFESNLLLLGGLAIIYHYVVYFVMRKREKKDISNVK